MSALKESNNNVKTKTSSITMIYARQQANESYLMSVNLTLQHCSADCFGYSKRLALFIITHFLTSIVSFYDAAIAELLFISSPWRNLLRIWPINKISTMPAQTNRDAKCAGDK